MSVSYTIKESLAGFWRNRTSSLITIFTVSISLLLLGIFTIITLNFSAVVDEIRRRVEIEVFLKDGLTVAQHQKVDRALHEIQGVKETEYISKEDAARIFEDEFGQSFFDILDENPLPESFRVRLEEGYNNTDSVAVIAARIENFLAVESVVYRKQFLNLIDKRARAFRLATLFIGLILAISAMILVANTIRLTILAKREIIHTMKLVGATPGFIRMPFLLEGVFHGIIGGILAALLIAMAFNFFILPIAEDLLVSFQISLGFYVMLVIVGGLLGLAGSMISIGRFLKEALVAQV